MHTRQAIIRFVPAAILMVLMAAAPAFAADKRKADNNQPSDTVRRIERETGGRVLKVEPIHRGGRDMSRVKVLTPDGRVRVMRENRGPRATTGSRSGASQQPQRKPATQADDDGQR